MADKTELENKNENAKEKKEKKSSRSRLTKEQQSTLCDKLSFAGAEAYKLLRTNLQFTMPDKDCRIIGLTSSIRGEGKSTTAVNLSYTIAQSGKRVLLIDGDMRLPTVHTKLSLTGSPGLSNLLAGLCDEREALRVSKYYNNWYILPAGDIPPNPSELLGSERMHHVIDRFSELFDYIVLDLPPVNIVTDALVVAPWTDGLLLVVRQNFTTGRALHDCMYQVERVKAHFLGFIMTDADLGELAYKKYGRYGKYRRYSRYGRYGKGYGYGGYGYGGYGYGGYGYGYGGYGYGGYGYGGYGYGGYGYGGHGKTDKETRKAFRDALRNPEDDGQRDIFE